MPPHPSSSVVDCPSFCKVARPPWLSPGFPAPEGFLALWFKSSPLASPPPLSFCERLFVVCAPLKSEDSLLESWVPELKLLSLGLAVSTFSLSHLTSPAVKPTWFWCSLNVFHGSGVWLMIFKVGLRCPCAAKDWAFVLAA